MPDHSVIGDVSLTLQTKLSAALSTLTPAPPPITQVHDLSGTIPTDPPLLTIFLYEVTEDPTSRNRPRVRDSVPPDVSIRKPPMALLLRYLVTAWSGDRVTDQKMLGRVLQVLYDDAIVSGPDLQGGLAGTDQAVKVTLASMDLEQRTRVWHAIQKPYRLSINYEVRVVNLDSEVARLVRPVSDRVLEPALPGGAS